MKKDRLSNRSSRLRARWAGSGALALAAAFTAFVGGASAAQPLPQPSHIVIVMEENKNFDQIVGNTADAPFINNQLINGGLLFSNSHAIEHPSQPNYLDFFSGSNQGVNSGNPTANNSYNFPALAAKYAAMAAGCAASPSCAASPNLAQLKYAAGLYASYAAAIGASATGDGFPSPANFNIPAGIPFTTPNLASELAAKGKTFVEYSDGLAAAGAADASGNAILSVVNNPADPFSVGYAHRHDPVADWLSAAPTGNQLPNTAEQDFGNFAALSADFSKLPTVSFIVPSTIDDMHDGALGASIQNGDSWLAANLAGYLAWAKDNNSLLILTTDENDFLLDGEDATNQILTVLNGDPRLFTPGVSGQDFNHFDLLRTIEDMYGTGYAGASAAAHDLYSLNGMLAPVPEPASWSMMMLGFGGLGAMLRRQRRVLLAA
jgi:hypothetical protein